MKKKKRKKSKKKAEKNTSWIDINKQIQDKLQKEADSSNFKCYEWHPCKSFPFGASIFLLIGIIWLAKNQGWLTGNFWPFLFIVIGLLFLIRHLLVRK